jgi:hypothetical protein
VTLLVLVGILLVAAYYGWQTVVNPSSEAETPTHTPTTTKSTPQTKVVCIRHKTFKKGTTIEAKTVKVNVYNAGTVLGQAGQVLTSLTHNGFREGIADNPPPGITATNVTIITHNPKSPQVRLVKQQFEGLVKIAVAPRSGLALGVNVVIGSNFVGVRPTAPTTYTLAHAITVCTKSVTRPVTG